MKLLKNSRGGHTYTLTGNSSKYPSLRIVINGRCGLEEGDQVYQGINERGNLEFFPVSRYTLQDFENEV